MSFTYWHAHPATDSTFPQPFGILDALSPALHSFLGKALIFKPRPRVALSPIRSTSSHPHTLSSPLVRLQRHRLSALNGRTRGPCPILHLRRACQLYVISNESMPWDLRLNVRQLTYIFESGVRGRSHVSESLYCGCHSLINCNQAEWVPQIFPLLFQSISYQLPLLLSFHQPLQLSSLLGIQHATSLPG